MPSLQDRPTEALARDVALGLVAGAVVGGALAVVVAAQGFPDWGEVVWSFTVAGLLVVPVAVVLRVIGHRMHDSVWRHVPLDERPVTKTYVLQTVRALNVIAAAVVGTYLVLLLTHGLGDGTWMPDP